MIRSCRSASNGIDKLSKGSSSCGILVCTAIIATNAGEELILDRMLLRSDSKWLISVQMASSSSLSLLILETSIGVGVLLLSVTLLILMTADVVVVTLVMELIADESLVLLWIVLLFVMND